MTAAVFGCAVPVSIEEKTCFLHENGIALWDVIASCDIVGSSDTSIRNVTPNDLSPIFRAAKIERIFTNGATAKKYYDRYTLPLIGREAICLPSTSPANAAWSVERLTEAWRIVAE